MNDSTYPKTDLPYHFPTQSGGRVDLSNPDPDDIRIEDCCKVAHQS